MRFCSFSRCYFKLTLIIIITISFCLGNYVDTIKTELGFNWEKLENANSATKFEIALPRSHPIKEYGKDLWNYTVIRSEDENFLEKIDSIFITKDTVDNFLLKVVGTYSELSYQAYQIVQTGTVPQIDLTKSYPFPEEYPDNVKLFLLPGINIESDNIKILNLIDSLKINRNDMAKAAMEIGTSAFITSIPYDEDDLSSVINGAVTTSWCNEILSSAVETVIAGKAVCVEIARLQTAMCRAAGIPARTISWMDLHTWTEVWINGYGWLQMDKGYFPHYMPTTLARLSDNNDNVWFDWSPADKALFSTYKVKMDSQATINQIENTKVIIAKPTELSLPVFNKGDRIGLIPIGTNYGLSLIKSDSSISLNIVDRDTIISEDPRKRILHFTKTWPHLTIANESLEINIENLTINMEIESINDWIMLKIKSIDVETSINDITKKRSNDLKFFFKNHRQSLGIKFNDHYKSDNITVQIFNVKGELVQKIKKSTNKKYLYWNGKNLKGQLVSSGLYIIAIYSNNKLLISNPVNWLL